jgi:hypothetical protein
MHDVQEKLRLSLSATFMPILNLATVWLSLGDDLGRGVAASPRYRHAPLSSRRAPLRTAPRPARWLASLLTAAISACTLPADDSPPHRRTSTADGPGRRLSDWPGTRRA